MKCQHCGINFDDGDRECPICGARAGSRGRMSVPQYTGYDHKKHNKKDCTHQTFTKDVTFTGEGKTSYTGAGRHQGEARRKAKSVWLVVVAACLLIQLLPLGIGLVEDLIDGLGVSFSAHTAIPEPDFDGSYPAVPEPAGDGWYSGEPDDEWDGENSEEDFGLYDLLGTDTALATLPGPGGRLFQLDAAPGEFGEYALTISNAQDTYMESGYASCGYIAPEDGIASEGYPPEEFDCFFLILSPTYTEWSGSEPEWHARTDPDAGLWFLAYQEREQGYIVLEDIDDTGIFNGERFLALPAAGMI